MALTESLDELYDDHILDHYESPYHKGHLACPSCSHADRNPICGDQIALELRIADERVSEAYFHGRGCAISQAAASILCESIEGKTVAELKDFQAKDMLELIRVPLSPSRQKCGLLAFKVLKTMLYARETPATPSIPSQDLPTPVAQTGSAGTRPEAEANE